MADDIQDQVNAWFAAPENANATPAQVAATVQGLGGLGAIPGLADALAAHYNTSSADIGTAYNQLIGGTSGGSTSITPSTGATGALSTVSTPTTSVLTPTNTTTNLPQTNNELTNYTSAAQVLSGLQNGSLDNTTVQNALAQVNNASNINASSAPSTTNVTPTITSNVLQPTTSDTTQTSGTTGTTGTTGTLNTSNGVITPYSSSTAYGTNPAPDKTSNEYTQTYNAIQLGNTHVVQNGTDEDNNPIYALLDGNGNPLPASVIDNGNGTYITTSSSVTASYNPYKAANSAMSSKRFV